MARIRTIKPEFPQSESIGRLSRDARLLFIQLWTVVDDHGRSRAAPQLLAGQLYPYDTDALKLLQKWLTELEAEGHIRLYEIDGSRYLDIPSWPKHQRIDNAGKSNIPEYVAEFRGGSPRSAEIIGDPPLDLGPRKGEDLGEEKDIRAVAVATRPDERFEEFWKSYPKRDGANPKVPARKKFLAAVKSGADPEVIISAAKRYAAHCQTKQQTGTSYVAQAMTWLNQQRWGDYPEPRSASVHGPPAEGLPSDEELRRKYEVLNEQRGRTAPPQAAAAERGRPDLPGKLLVPRTDDDPNDVPRGRSACDLAGQPGVRRLADLLPRSLAVAAMGARGDGKG